MSKAKEKRIKKLRTRVLWPSVMWIVIIGILFALINAFILEVMFHSTLSNKISLNEGRARKTADYLMSLPMDTEEDIKNLYAKMNYDYEHVGYDILSVVGADGDGNIRFMKGNLVPNMDSFAPMKYGRETFLVSLDSNSDLLQVEDGEMTVHMTDVWKNFDLSGFEEDGALNPEWGNTDYIHMGIWYGFMYENAKIYIRMPLSITNFEVVSVIIPLIVTSLLCVVIFLYQIIAIIRVVIERRKLAKILYTDVTTGGNNWTYFTKTASKRRFYNKNKGYVIVSMLIEKFDAYCLIYGDRQGEELLENVYKLLSKNLKGNEIFCRKEGAEYALLLTKDDRAKLNGRLFSFFSQIAMKYPELKQKIVAGVAEVGSNSKIDMADIYNCAAIARKSLVVGSNVKISWFDEGMKEKMVWAQTVENEMEQALKNGEFVMYLQPKYTTSSEQIGGAEALCRWIKPGVGLIPPGKFIPIFENNGFIVKLDDFMLTEVAKAQAKWMEQGYQLFPISVNVSRAHFAIETLAEDICKIVDRYKVPHEYIELELTESAFFDDKDVLLKTISKLKEAGFPISMDDFGAGFSSLNTLKELPLDVIKLDAEFFRGDDVFDRAHLIVSETIMLAKKLSMHIVAEGIETRDQVDFLAGEKCDLIQGFFFAKPMPVSEFEESAYGKQNVEE